jgi:hypothetical protein
MPVEGWTPSAARTLVLPAKAAAPRGFIQAPEALRWPDKRQGDVLDYSVDLTNRLDPGDTVASFIAAVLPSEVTISETDTTGAIATVWLSLGSENLDHTVTLTANTTHGRRFVLPIALYVLPSAAITGDVAIYGQSRYGDGSVYGS